MSGAPIRLLLVCESFTGGCKRHVLDILGSLPDEDFRITLVYADLREPGAGNDIPARDGLDTKVVRMRRRIAPLSDLRSVLALRRIIRDVRPGIIHLHSSKAGLLGRVAARLAGDAGRTARIVYSPHGPAFQVGGLRGALYLAAERMLARLGATLVAVSEGERDLIASKDLCAREDIVLIPNGIDPKGYDIPAPGAEPLTIGMMGRLVEQKGATCLIAAAPAVARACADVRFVVAGDGPARFALERAARAAGIRVDFVGECSARDFLCRVDIVALPSLWEGLPYVLLEAMAAGRPIVASNIPGVSDTLADAGVLVPPSDARALAEALCNLVSDRDLRQRLAADAKRRVAAFTLDAFSSRVAAFYRATAS